MDASDIAAGKSAIAQIAGFPATINNIAGNLSGIALGPYTILVNCTYDSGCKKATYNASILFSNVGVIEAFHQAQQQASTFSSAFSPAQQWLTNTLPMASTTLHTNASVILKLLGEITTGGPTPAQKLAIDEAFGKITEATQTGLTQLQLGEKALIEYGQFQQAMNTNVQNALSNLENSVSQAMSQLASISDGKPCGQADAQRQFSVIAASYRSTISAYENGVKSFESAGKQANDALKTLIGFFIDYGKQIASLRQDFSAAEYDSISNFMKRVKVETGTHLWDNLAAQARQSFGITASRAMFAATAATPTPKIGEVAQFLHLTTGIREQLTAVNRGPWLIAFGRGNQQISFAVQYPQTAQLIQRLYTVATERINAMEAALLPLRQALGDGPVATLPAGPVKTAATGLSTFTNGFSTLTSYTDKLLTALAADQKEQRSKLLDSLAGAAQGTSDSAFAMLRGIDEQMEQSVKTIIKVFSKTIPSTASFGESILRK